MVCSNRAICVYLPTYESIYLSILISTHPNLSLPSCSCDPFSESLLVEVFAKVGLEGLGCNGVEGLEA